MIKWFFWYLIQEQHSGFIRNNRDDKPFDVALENIRQGYQPNSMEQKALVAAAELRGRIEELDEVMLIGRGISA